MTGALQGKVAVITGASSGVGRAAARAFAAEGAAVVLAARRPAMLEEEAALCREMGADALAVPADVSQPEEVVRLARAARDAFGRIDIWVNNAGVGVLGEFAAVPMEAHEQVIRTDLLAYLRGAHAVLPQFKRQGGGVLINNISVGGWVPAPYAAAYSAAKAGLRAFGEALAGELGRWPDIHVCDVFPSFLDTPGVQHGANFTGRRLKPMPPVVDPERVARAMVRLARHPRRVTVVGAPAWAGRIAHAVAPQLTTRIMGRLLEAYLERAEPAEVSAGNLFVPARDERGIAGGWRRPATRRLAGVAGAAAVGAVILLALSRATAAPGWNHRIGGRRRPAARPPTPRQVAELEMLMR
jgi:short-subunit dehydrogenase